MLQDQRLNHWDDLIRQRCALIATLSACAAELDVELDWTAVVRAVATLDWATAAVIAKRQGPPVPPLPAPEVLLAQRSR